MEGAHKVAIAWHSFSETKLPIQIKLGEIRNCILQGGSAMSVRWLKMLPTRSSTIWLNCLPNDEKAETIKNAVKKLVYK